MVKFEQSLVAGQEEDDRQIIERLLRLSDPDLQVVEVEASPACGAGDNFMSAVSRIEVTIEAVQKVSTKRSVLMKKQLDSQERREAFRCDPAFRNEAEAYHVVIPELEGFSGRRMAFPECIHASSNMIILEDLKPAGFRMAERRKGLDFQHAVLALKELGRFHGTSLAMKYLQPKKFNGMKATLQELIFVPANAPVFGSILEDSLTNALSALKASCSNVEKEKRILPVVEKLENLKGSLFRRLFKMVCPKEPLSVICHGDFYSNNMLFRYNEMNIPEEVCFVDLQACRYSSLALDVLYLFCSSLEPGLLAAKHEVLLQSYHSALKAEVSKHCHGSVDITIDDLREELKSTALFGLIMGFVLLPAVTAKPGAFDNMNSEQLPSADEVLGLLSPEYFERVTDLILTFQKLGYI